MPGLSPTMTPPMTILPGEPHPPGERAVPPGDVGRRSDAGRPPPRRGDRGGARPGEPAGALARRAFSFLFSAEGDAFDLPRTASETRSAELSASQPVRAAPTRSCRSSESASLFFLANLGEHV